MIKFSNIWKDWKSTVGGLICLMLYVLGIKYGYIPDEYKGYAFITVVPVFMKIFGLKQDKGKGEPKSE